MPASPGWNRERRPVGETGTVDAEACSSETGASLARGGSRPLPQPEIHCRLLRDVAVLAFPTPEKAYRIRDIQEKALDIAAITRRRAG